MTSPPQIAVVGGGMVGCAAAAFLAEAGARVELFERGRLAGAASGRNSGALQHPFDPVLADLHSETMRHLREMDEVGVGQTPAGVLVLAHERAALDAELAEVAAHNPELDPRIIPPDELRELEPALSEGLWALRLETGYPVRPEAATLAFAERARRAGAELHEGRAAWPWVTDRGARGVLAGGRRHPAEAVLVAAGPWAPETIDPTRAWRPIEPVWGVVLEVELEDPPRAMVEGAGVEAVAGAGTTVPESVFSLISSGRSASLGSTFLPAEPDPADWAAALVRGGAPFVPELERAPVVGARACARPQARDGRPLVGPVEAVENLWIAAGHGPWGISTGAATGRRVADAILGQAALPRELDAGRFAFA